MTTTVIISCPIPNHNRLHVRSFNPETNVTTNEKIVNHGESYTLYVYGGNSLTISETPNEESTND